jgi:hypothetical protein
VLPGVFCGAGAPAAVGEKKSEARPPPPAAAEVTLPREPGLSDPVLVSWSMDIMLPLRPVVEYMAIEGVAPRLRRRAPGGRIIGFASGV